MKLSAVIIALNEEDFIQPCIKAIYPFVDRILVQTNYDRSWGGKIVKPDSTVDRILRMPDGDGKISLHIMRIPDEALARNWLMRSDGYVLDHKHRSTTSSPGQIRSFCEKADYFWVLDADEIYDPKTIPDIISYLGKRRPNMLKVKGMAYFKSWNYRIVLGNPFYQPGFIRPGTLFQINRYIFPPLLLRAVKNKYWNFGKTANRAFDFYHKIKRIEFLPDNIGVFHHGSYVGSDERVFKKFSLSTHSHEFADRWYEKVWKGATASSENLHPIDPPEFRRLEFIPDDKLPSSITQEEWPRGYLGHI